MDHWESFSVLCYLPRNIKIRVFRSMLSGKFCNTASSKELPGLRTATSGQHQHDVCKPERRNMQLVCWLEGCQCNIVLRSLLIHRCKYSIFFRLASEGRHIYSIATESVSAFGLGPGLGVDETRRSFLIRYVYKHCHWRPGSNGHDTDVALSVWSVTTGRDHPSTSTPRRWWFCCPK